MIFELIYKYLDNQASEEEIATIFEWIEASETNKTTFFDLKKSWAFTSKDDESKRAAWKKISKEISQNKKRYKYWRYAAVILVLIGLGSVLNISKSSKNTITTDHIVLESDNGTVSYIDLDEEKKLLNIEGAIIVEQESNEIVYKPNRTKTPTEYHTLKIPNGKNLKVTLSDGSIVHLNSGTIFKYPNQFANDSNREVYLTGEAFFEVAKDKTRPFLVYSNQVAVEVLGTKFNINAYPDNKFTETVLVEGLVSIYERSNKEANTLLAPNYKATWNQVTKIFDIENVDVNMYTAWTKGEIVFRDASFAKITKTLERSYNVKIINNDGFLADQKFTGTINIREFDIDNILELLQIDTPFEYTRQENMVRINASSK
ncbi:hypothetical protein GCM10023311_10750 [Flaviramulus aquimarinus]|uniref:FecR family protein n=1 Tax=Flaviramulus aquimarinus TaxID=1170456 RepID=A0ABP9EYN1_9FLAO